MGPHEARVVKAIHAMKAMAISEKRVKPVLKNLLRLYDKNWELIEDENYRVLIDAIFEQEIVGEDENQRGEVQLLDESTQPLRKKLRSRTQDDQISASSEVPRITPKVERADLPIAHRLRSAECKPTEAPSSLHSLSDCEEVSHLHVRDRAVHSSVSPQPQSKDKRREPTSSSQVGHMEEIGQDLSHSQHNLFECDSIGPQAIYRQKGVVPARFSLGVHLKEPKIEPGITIQPKEKTNARESSSLMKAKNEPLEDDPQFEIPIAIIPPPEPQLAINDDSLHVDGCSTVNGFSGQGNGSNEHLNVAELVSKAKQDVVNDTKLQKSFEIASSPSGEVKISLNCNHPSEQPDFRIPSLDAVLKAVEDKCLRSYRILEPNFSLKNLMQEMCHSFLELSNKAPDPKEDSVIHLAADFNFLKKPNMQNAFGLKGGQQGSFGMPGSSSNGSLNLQSSSETSKVLLLESHDNQKVDGDTNGKKDTEENDPNFSNSHSLVVVPHAAADCVTPLHDVNDISKGEEKLRISLINELSSEPFPPKFYYIPRNIVYQNAYVNFSLARIGDEDCCSSCFGDCLSSSITCACTRETGGEFAYTLEGLVKEKFLDECISLNRNPPKDRHYYCQECPLERSKDGLSDSCKGHLIRKFIKECWSKCGCSMQCGNRVVQRGIRCNLQVFFTSEGKGWGLRTLEDLPRGTFVCEYVGEVLTNTELHERNMRSSGNEKHTYPVLLDADWGSEGVLKDEEALCLDATYYGNVARFINHRCFDGNMVEIPVEVETPDHHYYHLAFFTTRNVDALEELTWDYGIDFNDHNHPVKGFRCLCGSKCCRDMKRSHRTKSKR